jgi:peptide-methionine (S)-S-oxide reductase
MKIEKATFAGGCYWCTEAVFLPLKGVEKVTSGFIGGFIKNPAYREVCNDVTGHAEAIEIEYETEQIDYKTLLEVFFASHDPTTLNRQGADVGSQYRSAIFYHTEEQKVLAEDFIQFLTEEAVFEEKIVTQIEEATIFYKADDDHQNYYNLNKEQGYCQYVITPKVNKLRKNYAHLLK